MHRHLQMRSLNETWSNSMKVSYVYTHDAPPADDVIQHKRLAAEDWSIATADTLVSAWAKWT